MKKTATNPAIGRRAFLRRSTTLVAGAGATLVLTACGQKGPLYIPGPEDAKKKKKKS